MQTNNNGRKPAGPEKTVYIEIQPNTRYVLSVPPEVCDAAEIQTKEQLLQFLLESSGGDALLMAGRMIDHAVPVHTAGVDFSYPAIFEPVEPPWEGIGIASDIMNFYSRVSWDAIKGFTAGWLERNTMRVPTGSVLESSATEWVYLVKSGELHKIGMSTSDVKKRIETLKTASPTPLEVVCVVETDDARGLEALLHKMFKTRRVKGEWFSLTPDDVAYIRALADDEAA